MQHSIDRLPPPLGLLPGLLLGLLLLPLLAQPAEARGGAWRGPGGSVPPGLREPSDPTPPPPPPPAGPRTGPGPTMPTVPTTPPPPPSVRVAPRPVPAPHGIRALSFSEWPFWYHHHKAMVEWPLGRRSGILPEGETARLHAEALARIVAAARGGSEVQQSISAAGLIALGKAATAPEHVDLLLGALRSSHRSLIERESAALGLGLLRRHPIGLLEGERAGRVRQALLGVLASDREQARLRGFAAAALGLLGDQPNADPEATTARLFDVLRYPHGNMDIGIGALLALSRQPGASFTADQRRTLRTLAYEGRLAGRQILGLLRTHALAVLGRMGAAEDLGRMQGLLVGRRDKDANLRRSAVLALGFLAARYPIRQRAAVVETILSLISRGVGGERDDTVRHFALASLPRLLAGPDGRGTAEALDRTLAGEVLLRTAAFGHDAERPWAALALGELLRDGPWGRRNDLGPFEAKARRVLRSGLETGSPLSRAGFALALGLAEDRTSEGRLQALAVDERLDAGLRGYAALALAHLGPASTPTRLLLRRALTERRSEMHRMLAAVSVGLSGDDVSVPSLKELMGQTKSYQGLGALAVALATIGTPEAGRALLDLAGAEGAPVRALAIAGLGRLLDPGFYPSLVLLTWRLNYRASTDLTNELLSIL